jgi:hypothetical protein
MSRTPYVTRREFMKESALRATGGLMLGMTHETKVIPVSAKRAQVSLDGIWRFIPAVGGKGGPPKVGWGSIKVPGSWASRRGRGRSSDLVARGSGPGRRSVGTSMHWPASWLGNVFESQARERPDS